MRRFPLHLLLVFTLVLNGISAPWAKARMAHDDHHPTSSDVAATPAMAEHGAHAHHGVAAHPDGADRSALPDSSDTDPHEPPCCEGAACGCGCFLPPALHVLVPVSVISILAQIDFILPAPTPTPRHDSPPYRPPAA